MAIHHFDLKLNWTKMLTPTVLHLAFSQVNGEKLAFIPGQFITFVFNINDKVVRRSYSISTIPGQSDEIEIAVSPVNDGIATKILFNLQPGEVLTASGPFGRLILPNENHPQHYVLAATGTGVSPYRSMLPQIDGILAESPHTKVTLLLGVQHRHDLLYGDDFLNFANRHERFKFRAYLSREHHLNAAHEYKGYLHQAFPELNLDPQHDLAYLCGNPNMIDDAFALLTNMGFPTQHVRREKYISAGVKG